MSARIRGIVGIALRQLRHDRARTFFAAIGVAFAVLAVTLLIGVGAGVVDTGDRQFDAADRDLWITGGPIQIEPGTVGGFRNPLVNAHEVAADIDNTEGVNSAVPLSFQAVYVSPDGEEFDTILGTGVPGGGSAVSLEEGDGFSGSDTHYAGGDYDGEMGHEVIIDPDTADRYDIEIGDTIHIGGSIRNARENEFTVVGISSTFSNLLGTGTVAIRLSELQTLTGAAHDDRATLIVVTVEDGGDPDVVRQEIQERHPDYTVRTNREQFTAVLQRQAVVIAGGLSLVGVALLAGMVLSLNLLLSLVYQQRRSLAVLQAIGGSRLSVVGIAVTQAVVIAALGGSLGLLLTPPAAAGLEALAATVTGFEGLVQVPWEAYALGGATALTFALVGALLGAWRATRSATVAALTR